jgi:osmoprotectant transport system permease protein
LLDNISNRPYKASLLGAVAGLFGLSLPYLSVKANRIVAGKSRALWDIGGQTIVVTLTIVLALCVLGTLAAVVLQYRGRHRAGTHVSLVAGAGVFLVSWLLIGAASGILVPAADTSPARVSPAAGFWLLMLSSYIVITTSLRYLGKVMGRRGRLFSTSLVFGLFLFLAILIVGGALNSLSVMKEFNNQPDRFAQALISHLTITGVSVLGAIVIGVPLGILAWKRAALEQPVFVVVNGIQTIPSLALFGIMIAPLAILSRTFPVLRELGIQGIGNAPAIIAITLYALLPIVRNTYTSLSIIDRSVVDAGTGMGMGKFEMLRFVEVPLSLPIILGGIRISAVQAVGNTAVAALIGAGGLGAFVFQGLGQAAPDLILLGVFPIIVLAVAVDRIMKFLVEYLTPQGVRSENEGERGNR